MSRPLLVMLAGPNGAGKSTFFETYLAGLGLPFLNADRLAMETGMGAYEAAAQIAAARQHFIECRTGFITESVFSDPVGDKVAILSHAEEVGFDVQLIFIGIADAEMSLARVASRVQAGGHGVPEEKVIARYARTLENLARAITTLSHVIVFDNSSFDEPYRLVAEFRSGGLSRQGARPPLAWARRFLPPA